MPTHFRYSRVEPSSLGLTSAEILMATDAELNSYISLKRLAPYRKDKYDPRRPEKLKELRKTLGARGIYTDKWGANNGGQVDKTQKRKGKKERKRMKEKVAIEETIKQEQQEGGQEPRNKKRKRKHAKGENTKVVA